MRARKGAIPSWRESAGLKLALAETINRRIALSTHMRGGS